jgi:hypothetical protein
MNSSSQFLPKGIILKTDFQKLFLIVVLSVGFTACGNSNSSSTNQAALQPAVGEVALPDDPNDEPVAENQIGVPPPLDAQGFEDPTMEGSALDSALSKYSYVDPSHMIQQKHLNAALAYFDQNKSRIKNQKYLSVIDFSKSSKLKRFFIINMATGAVTAIHTAHGKGSDTNRDGYAERFSNVSGSNASSLGFYLTAETYNGSNGYSLRLDGLSTTNSNARARAVVIHGASYVQESNVIQGRSWGCPALDQSLKTKVIDMLKNGSLIYAAN